MLAPGILALINLLLLLHDYVIEYFAVALPPSTCYMYMHVLCCCPIAIYMYTHTCMYLLHQHNTHFQLCRNLACGHSPTIEQRVYNVPVQYYNSADSKINIGAKASSLPFKSRSLSMSVHGLCVKMASSSGTHCDTTAGRSEERIAGAECFNRCMGIETQNVLLSIHNCIIMTSLIPRSQ